MANAARDAHKSSLPRLTWAGVLLAVLLAVIGAAAGAALASSNNGGGTAKATVLVDPLEGNPFAPTSAGGNILSLETEARLVASDTVASLVKTRLDLRESPDGILEGLSVEVRENTQIMDISYSDTNRAQAVERAQAFATVFLEFRKSRAQSLIIDREATIQNELDKQNAQLTQLLEERKQAEFGSASASLLDRQIDGVADQGAQIRAQLAEFSSSTADPGQIISPAAAEAPGLLASRGFLTVLGLLIGLALAAALIAARSLLIMRSNGRESVDYPIATIYYDQAAEMERKLPSYGEEQPILPASFENLTVALMARNVRRPVCVILVTDSEDVASPVSGAGLAMSVAMAGERIALLDVTNLDPKGSTGLNQVLLGQVDLETALVKLGKNLVVLPSGSSIAERESLLQTPDMALVVERLTELSDIVLILAGPMQSPSTVALIDLADVVLVESGRADTPASGMPHGASVIFVAQQRRRSLTKV